MTQTHKNLMTKRGHEKLLHEFEGLCKVERPKVVKGVEEAAAEGDRSENAEYIYGKKRLREIDKRLQYLSRLLQGVLIVEERSLRGEQVCFGATVVVRDHEGNINRWMIVGDGEADTREGTISWKSPVGHALLDKYVGDLVEVERPKGMLGLEVIGLLFGSRLIAGQAE